MGYNNFVRLDLYLKFSRLVKRRAVAQAMCVAGRVFVNGIEAKPSKDVRPGDKVSVMLPSKTIELEIIALPDKGAGSESGELYRVTKEVRS